jgi:Tfp pilus assembly protein PilE
MAIRLDQSLLEELGLASLPETEKRALLSHIYETLEMRVGMRLADQMTNEQLDEFEKYFQAKDDNGAFRWLETNFPNYKDIVQEEFNRLKQEVGQSATQILQASQLAQANNNQASSMGTSASNSLPQTDGNNPPLQSNQPGASDSQPPQLTTPPPQYPPTYGNQQQPPSGANPFTPPPSTPN